MASQALTVPRSLGGTLFTTYTPPSSGGGGGGPLSGPTLIAIPRSFGGTLFVLFEPQRGPNAPAIIPSPYAITQFFTQGMTLSPLPAPKGFAGVGVGPGVGSPLPD